MGYNCSVFFHNYYGAHKEWIDFLCNKISIPFSLFYNIVEDSIYNVNEIITQDIIGSGKKSLLEKHIVYTSPNQGKDIGGKLVMMDSFIRLAFDSDLIVFLHDKKSPYKIQSEQWSAKLFRIIEPSFINVMIKCFEKNEEVGIVTSADSIYNEFDFTKNFFSSNNRDILKKLCSDYKITHEDFRYVAGTMFWVRTKPLIGFFNRYSPLEIRSTLEKGNVSDETAGTFTHAWERLLCWIVFQQGYTIKGLKC